MIDITKWIGNHVWQPVIYDDKVIGAFPDLSWCVNAIFMIIFVITFLLCIFKLIESIT